MTAALQRSGRRVRHYRVDAAIGTLLAQLGLDYSTRNFWTDNSFILEEILHDAFVAYRDRIIRVQPRAAGDSETEATALNALWSEIKRRFEQHLRPHLFSRMPQMQRINRGTSLRCCGFRLCGKPFETVRPDKRFCTDQHRNAERIRRYWDRQKLYRVSAWRVCANEHCTNGSGGGRKRFRTTYPWKKFCTGQCQLRAKWKRATARRRATVTHQHA